MKDDSLLTRVTPDEMGFMVIISKVQYSGYLYVVCVYKLLSKDRIIELS
ncbi:MAG: hypothetical protein U9N85_00970 [Bacteroidota bacterium]|nr:hypothetical protein [Bacteroidota bacterium]